MMQTDTKGGAMRLKRDDAAVDEGRFPVRLESNSNYIPAAIGSFLLVALAAHVLMRILDLPGWIAWPIASLYLVDKLRRARNEHTRLADKWNGLLEDWLEHERRVHEQRMKELRDQPPGDQ